MGWCAVCSTLHGGREPCPGPLQPTGPETEARRIRVYTGRFEAYGVLVAPVEGGWRARIVTLPRMLWSVPGRRDTVKFFGPSREAAVGAALAFVETHCASRGHRILDADASRQAAAAGPPGAPIQPLVERETRLAHDVPARFVGAGAEHRARTADLSRGGLFLATGRPLPAGTEIRVVLEVAPFEVPLRGTVAWVRTHAAPGAPVGMGVRLQAPPTMYVRYVGRLIEARRAGPGGAGGGGVENPG